MSKMMEQLRTAFDQAGISAEQIDENVMADVTDYAEQVLPWETDSEGNVISYDVHCDSCTCREWAETEKALQEKLLALGWTIVGDEALCGGCSK